MHEDWWALWAVWPWHARSHIHITPRLRVNSIAPLLKTPLPAEHTHTRTHVCMHARAHRFSLSFFSLIRRRSPATRVTRFAHFLQLALTHRFRSEGTGSEGSAQRAKGEKKKRNGSGALGCVWGAREPPKKPSFGGVGGAIKGTAFRGLRANIAVPWGLRKEIIQERSEWAETGWKRRTNPGWLGAAGRALFHPDPGETHEDRGEAPGLHVNVSQSTCVSDQRHSYPVLFPR